MRPTVHKIIIIGLPFTLILTESHLVYQTFGKPGLQNNANIKKLEKELQKQATANTNKSAS